MIRKLAGLTARLFHHKLAYPCKVQCMDESYILLSVRLANADLTTSERIVAHVDQDITAYHNGMCEPQGHFKHLKSAVPRQHLIIAASA